MFPPFFFYMTDVITRDAGAMHEEKNIRPYGKNKSIRVDFYGTSATARYIPRQVRVMFLMIFIERFMSRTRDGVNFSLKICAKINTPAKSLRKRAVLVFVFSLQS